MNICDTLHLDFHVYNSVLPQCLVNFLLQSSYVMFVVCI